MMRKKIWKSSLSLCMALLLAAGLLTGCGGSDAPAEETPAAEDGQTQEATSGEPAAESTETASGEEIEFWNFFTGPDGDNMKVIVDGFNATNPAYRIKNVTMASGDLYTKIPTVVNSGEGIPDLTIVDVARIPGFYEQGLLEPMTSVMENAPEVKKENYNALVWDTGTFGGEQYAVPLDMGVIGVAYNKDLVEQYAPNVLDDGLITIDEIKEIIPEASADGIVTIPVSFFGYEQALALAKQEGADLFVDENTPNINSPEFTKAVTTLKEIVDLGGCSDEGEDNLQLFMAGEAIFCPDGVWDANALNAIEGLNWGITNALCYEPDTFCTFSNSNQFVMLKNENRSDEKEKVIADFLDYVRLNALEWARSGQVPASSAADDDAEYAAMNQHFFVSTPEVANSIQFNNSKYSGYANDAIGKVFGDILFGYIDVEEGLAQAQKQAEDNIAQNN